MNAKSSLVFLVVFSLFLAALVSRNAALAWMTLPFLFYLGAGLLSMPGEVKLTANRALTHERCEAGTAVSMTVTVENKGSAIARLHLLDPIPANVQVFDGVIELAQSLPAGAAAVLNYSFKAPRGRYTWSGVRVTVSDSFGLFEKTLELAGSSQVMVLPAQPTAARVRLHPPHTLRAAGPNLSRLAGSGVDFFCVREFFHGDPLRWVHWRLSARHPGQFFTKEFEREEMADIGIILDGNSAINLDNGGAELIEYSIQAAAVLAKSLLGMGNRVSMLTLGERVARVFPGTGKRQLALILNQLAMCAPGGKVSLDMLKYLPVRLFPSRSLLIVISPLRRTDVNPILRLRAEGYQVLLVSPDPILFSCRSPRNRLAIRAARLERAALLWKMREKGVHVIDWPVDQPLLTMVNINHWSRR